MFPKPSPSPKQTQSDNEESAAATPLVVTIESRRFYGGRRHYWTICTAAKPDELLSWGNAPTRILAELAAGIVLDKLQSGEISGGIVGPRKFRRR